MDEPSQEPKPEKLGRLAFAWCRIATASLLFGRFALPVAAFFSSMLFIWAWVEGKKDTKCYLKNPMAAVALWVVVLTIWVACEFMELPWWIEWVHR